MNHNYGSFLLSTSDWYISRSVGYANN